jgi:tetratricopeptide (TPR) repeat protein
VSLFRTLGDQRELALSLCCLGAAEVYSAAQWSAVQAEMDSLAPGAWPLRAKVWRFMAEAAMCAKLKRFDEALTLAEAGTEFSRSHGFLRASINFTRYAVVAERALGRLDDALSRCRDEIAAELRWRGSAHEITLGTYAAILTQLGRCAEARLALVQFFEASRRVGWLFFGQLGNAYVELALSEQRYSAAAHLLGYARVAWGDEGFQRRSIELLAALKPILDAATLERLLDEGKGLDDEAVCALTLETAPT